MSGSSLMTVLATCGNGLQGRLGHGAKGGSLLFPRIVGSLVGYNVKEVACGGAHTAVVTDDGSLFTFGDNTKGQLGHSDKDKYVPVPIEVVLPDPVEHVAAGEAHTLALTRTGEVWAWGSHLSGQLGIGAQPESVHKMPRLVKEISKAGVTQLVAGAEHSMALCQDGKEVHVWGHDRNGAMGTGTPGVVRDVPVRLRGALAGLQLRHISSGLYHSGAVDVEGRAWTWGMGTWWQLGHGNDYDQHTPKQVQGLINVGSLSLGHTSSWALTRDGRPFCWGTDERGTLAPGEKHWVAAPVKTPLESRTLPRMKSIASGWKHAMGITSDGTLLSWGWSGGYHQPAWGADGGAGQLGVGDDGDRWSPAKVQRLHTSQDRYYDLRTSYIKPWKVIQASCGRQHSAMVVQVHLDTRDLAE